MEQRRSGAAIAFAVVVTLGAILLIVGMFVPTVKFAYKGVDISDEMLELMGVDREEFEDRLSEEWNTSIEQSPDFESGYSYISDYESIDNAFDQHINTLKWVFLITTIVLLIVAVIFAWVKIPLITVIASILGAGAGVGYTLFLVLHKLPMPYMEMYSANMSIKFGFSPFVGFFLMIGGAVVVIVASIILMVVVSKAKKAVTAPVDDYPMTSYEGFQEMPPVDMGMMGESQSTIPLVDMDDQMTVPVQPSQPQAQSVGSQGTITTGVLVIDGSMKGVKIPIEDNGTLNVGKDPQMAQLVMDKTFLSVSRLHCTISYSMVGDCYFVTDNSSNGTFKSDGTRLMKGRKTSVPRQTVLYLATDACKIKLL